MPRAARTRGEVEQAPKLPLECRLVDVAEASLHEHVKRLAGARSFFGGVSERHEGEDEHRGADGRLAVMGIERAVDGAPYDQRTGHTRRGLHRIGTPNGKTHPVLIDCHAM